MTLNQNSNPFGNPQPQRQPINQIPTSQSMGFVQNTGSTILPTPLVPMSSSQPMMQPMQPTGTSSNPFL